MPVLIVLGIIAYVVYRIWRVRRRGGGASGTPERYQPYPQGGRGPGAAQASAGEAGCSSGSLLKRSLPPASSEAGSGLTAGGGVSAAQPVGSGAGSGGAAPGAVLPAPPPVYTPSFVAPPTGR